MHKIDTISTLDSTSKLFSNYFGSEAGPESLIYLNFKDISVKYHPFMGLIDLLLYCEANAISPKYLRIMYVDFSKTFQEYLIQARFHTYLSCIYYFERNTNTSENDFLEISESKDTFTVLLLDKFNTEFNFSHKSSNLTIIYITDEDERYLKKNNRLKKTVGSIQFCSFNA